MSRSAGSNPPAEAASEGADTEDVDADAGESAAPGTVASDTAGAGTEGAAPKDADASKDADAEPDVAEGRTESKTGDSALGLRKVVAPDAAGGRDSGATAGATETAGSTDSEMGSSEFSRLELSSSEEAAERGAGTGTAAAAMATAAARSTTAAARVATANSNSASRARDAANSS